ncbi:MAG: PilZ domain-containing protein [Candidatus Omnitrophica bacterium]|nr:PilZ domain-containing protein [Candidatus Omnitrophota bacterium]
MGTMNEKRKYPRFDTAARIHFKKLTDIDHLQEGFIKNVSAEGFCFSSKESLKPGDILEVAITEKDIEEAPICIQGQVAWSEKDPAPKDGGTAFLNGVKVLSVRKSDEARFVMLYCERMLAELKSFLHL